MLQLKNLNIGYKQKGKAKEVLSGLDLTIHKGELIALVGNNGIGKSTLLKTIIGTLAPLSGDVFVDGMKVHSESQAAISKLISIVLTDKIGGFNLRVFDVVASGRIPYLNSFGQLRDEDIKIIEHSLDIIGITELKGNLFDELSDGQRQKVLIAKSLAQQTPVILMDEPTAFLDFESRKQLFRLLKDLVAEQQKTVIVSSHDIEVLFRHADKVLFLKGKHDHYFGPADPVRVHFQ
jgi:iron complex transport system ATP-binding protein